MKRRSNKGYRKLCVEDRISLFMKRMRRNIPFEGLGIEFGIGKTTAEDYYYEMLDLFHKHLVQRLLDPPNGDVIDGWTNHDIKEKLPGAKFIVDLTSFRLKSKENAAWLEFSI